MNKNVRVVNQLEFEKLQKASSKRQARKLNENTNNSSTKKKGTAAGFKTTGLDNDNDNANATTIHNTINNNNNNNSNIKRRSTSARSELSDTSSEESSPIDNDSDSDSDDDADDAQLFDMEQFKKIRADVLERMDDHIATKKPYPKSPPGNALPKGVHYKASSGKNYVARSHHNSLQLHIGTWGQPEQAHQAWFYMSEAVADFERKKKNKKRKKIPEQEPQQMQQQHKKKKKRHYGNTDRNNDNSPAAAATGAPPQQPQQQHDDADADADADPHMAHFHRIRRRLEVLPCAEREQELLLSFSIMQEEMQLLFQRVNYFKTQLADERHRQIFRKEVRDNVLRRRGRGPGPEEDTNKNNDGNSNNNNVVDE